MSNEFELKDESVEVVELTEDEIENTVGGESGFITCSKDSILLGNVNGTIMTNIKVVSNSVGARYNIGLNKITITRTPGKKGMFKFTYIGDGRLIQYTVKFI